MLHACNIFIKTWAGKYKHWSNRLASEAAFLGVGRDGRVGGDFFGQAHDLHAGIGVGEGEDEGEREGEGEGEHGVKQAIGPDTGHNTNPWLGTSFSF